MGLRPPQHVRWNIFKAIGIYLKLFIIVANISISRCCRSPRSTSDNSIVFYDDCNKSTLTSLISEFWQWDTWAVCVFWMLTEKKNSHKHVCISVFSYFVCVCNISFKEMFLYSMLYPELVTLASTIKVTWDKYNFAINYGGCNQSLLGNTSQ